MKTFLIFPVILVLISCLATTFRSEAHESLTAKSNSTLTSSENPIVEVTGRIRSITGEAFHSRDGEKWANLEKGKLLFEGDWVKTAPGSFVYLALSPCEAALKIDENSILKLHKMKPDSRIKDDGKNDRVLWVKEGNILIANKNPKGDARWEIRTVLGCVKLKTNSECSISSGNLVRCSSGETLVVEVHCLAVVSRLLKNKTHEPANYYDGTPRIIDTPKEIIDSLQKQFKLLRKYRPLKN